MRNIWNRRRSLQGRIAAREGREPGTLTIFALESLRAGHISRSSRVTLTFPVLGDYRPSGWRLVETREVQWEPEGSPGHWYQLTILLEWLREGPEHAYAVLEDDGATREVFGHFIPLDREREVRETQD